MGWGRTSGPSTCLAGGEGKLCVYFLCKCHTPCSVKAAGSFLGEERVHLFSGIEFPAAALKGDK